MKLFNALQIVALFAAAPMGLDWLDTSDWKWAGAFWWVAIIVYVILFFFMVVSVRLGIDEVEKNI